ncbi:MAG: hypothetical protein IJ136_00075 [Erysipelotrichaceae bacterium]|nr:hypothetical protein [Erysipelotrichaceae bacterium]
MFEQYTEEMRMMSFNEFINYFIEQRISDLEGSTIRLSDLANKINDQERLFENKNDNRSFVEDHPLQAKEVVDQFGDQNITINLNDPDSLALSMVHYGIESIVSSSEYIQQHWNEEITLTRDVINQIKADLGIETDHSQDFETLYGYVYDDNGMHGDPVMFEATPENISLFIMNNEDHQTVITDSMDDFVVSSLPGGFLDQVSDPETRERILESLLPYQQYEKPLINFPIEDSYITIGDNTIHVQFNSDNDFDYTVYDKEMSEIDGGIIDNTKHLDSIPASLYESIKDLHHLNGEIFITEIHGLEHNEVLSRMETLRLKEDIIDGFKNGELWQSGHNGELYHLSDDQEYRITQFEEKYNCTVYHVVHDDYVMSDGTHMDMENYLYVSDSPSEWKLDCEDLKSGFAYCYVYNNTYPDLSEIGEIGMAPRDGGLVRNDIGYDFTTPSLSELTDKIDRYRFESDPLSYVEKEFYEGANRDQIFSEVRSNHLENERSFFRNEIDNHPMISGKAKEILSDIDAYSRDFNMNINNGIDLKGGMKL